MADIAKLLKARRGTTPIEDFAPKIPVRISTYYRYESEERNMSVPSIRTIANWAKANGDTELVNALASYALGFDLAEIKQKPASNN